MKKKIASKILIVASLVAMFGISEKVSAADYKEPIENSNSLLKNLEGSENIVVLSDGGIVQGGTVKVYSSDSPLAPVVIDPETNPSKLTVDEYNELKANGEEIPVVNVPVPTPSRLRSANPPTNIWKLAYGSSYTSNGFSGSGWRFAGYLFMPETGSGAYLRWQAFGDSGMVGSQQNAIDTKNTGSAYGNALYNNGYARYFTGYGNKTTFYSLNPVNGSYYQVANWD